MRALRRLRGELCIAFIAGAAACGPRAHIPALPTTPLNGDAPDAPTASLARSLAPVLFLQPDEWFSLERVVAVVHPTRRVIAYHLLWRDDVHGSWIPFTVPTDEEIVWVGHDSTGAPTDAWAFWHGKVLHTDWRDRGPVMIDVQWGKHGSLPRGVVASDLPTFSGPKSYYALTWLGLADIWLGKLTRPGPGCFCHGFGRYRQFTKPLLLGERIDVVARTDEPHRLLEAVFGKPFSKKKPWP